MINEKNITFTRSVPESIHMPTTYQLRYQLGYFETLPPEASQEIIDDTKRYLRLRLWSHHYGEFREPLHKLITLARMNARYEDIEPIRKLEEELLGLLEVPKAGGG